MCNRFTGKKNVKDKGERGNVVKESLQIVMKIQNL